MFIFCCGFYNKAKHEPTIKRERIGKEKSWENDNKRPSRLFSEKSHKNAKSNRGKNISNPEQSPEQSDDVRSCRPVLCIPTGPLSHPAPRGPFFPACSPVHGIIRQSPLPPVCVSSRARTQPGDGVSSAYFLLRTLESTLCSESVAIVLFL